MNFLPLVSPGASNFVLDRHNQSQVHAAGDSDSSNNTLDKVESTSCKLEQT